MKINNKTLDCFPIVYTGTKCKHSGPVFFPSFALPSFLPTPSIHLSLVQSEPATNHPLLVPELPQLPVPHRPSTGILDVPESFDDKL